MLRFLVQSLIHKLEEAGGVRYLRLILALAAIVAVVAIYDINCYRNFSTPEAMDAAQLARNLARGSGYTTEFIRPLSIYLLEKKHGVKEGAPLPDNSTDPGRLREAHPDLANPPVYPL